MRVGCVLVIFALVILAALGFLIVALSSDPAVAFIGWLMAWSAGGLIGPGLIILFWRTRWVWLGLAVMVIDLVATALGLVGVHNRGHF